MTRAPAWMRRTVRVRVPATTSNLGPGFDVLGLALSLHNEIEIEVLPQTGPALVRIEGEGAGRLPEGDENVIARTFRRQVGRLRNELRVHCVNRIPVARGLGSSAAARLGALLAARAFLGGDDAEKDEALLAAAVALEGHPDNVVPALFGGLWLCLPGGGPAGRVALREPKELAAVVCAPDFELPTEKARAALPPRVPLRDAVATAGRVGLLVHALEKRQYGLLREAMRDVLHQPYRARLVPGLREVIAAAEETGAFGAALSGAGPSVLAFAPRERAARVGRAMQKAFLKRRIESRAWTLGVDTQGATVQTQP